MKTQRDLGQAVRAYVCRHRDNPNVTPRIILQWLSEGFPRVAPDTIRALIATVWREEFGGDVTAALNAAPAAGARTTAPAARSQAVVVPAGSANARLDELARREAEAKGLAYGPALAAVQRQNPELAKQAAAELHDRVGVPRC
jgi:hypothetical protein